ncbi:hypothetical protein LINGRAPRIM_LOCUS2533, partial [Linum grandiflorum]
MTATYLMNRMPNKTLRFQAPKRLIMAKYLHIHSFSSELPSKCVFVSHTKGYKCYSPQLNRYLYTMDVSFFQGESSSQRESQF